MSRYVFAATSVSVRVPGQTYPVPVRRGEVWFAEDPFVKAYPDLFSEHPPRARGTEPEVEQASAAPGEKRTTRRAS